MSLHSQPVALEKRLAPLESTINPNNDSTKSGQAVDSNTPEYSAQETPIPAAQPPDPPGCTFANPPNTRERHSSNDLHHHVMNNDWDILDHSVRGHGSPLPSLDLSLFPRACSNEPSSWPHCRDSADLISTTVADAAQVVGGQYERGSLPLDMQRLLLTGLPEKLS